MTRQRTSTREPDTSLCPGSDRGTDDTGRLGHLRQRNLDSVPTDAEPTADLPEFLPEAVLVVAFLATTIISSWSRVLRSTGLSIFVSCGLVVAQGTSRIAPVEHYTSSVVFNDRDR